MDRVPQSYLRNPFGGVPASTFSKIGIAVVLLGTTAAGFTVGRMTARDGKAVAAAEEMANRWAFELRQCEAKLDAGQK